MEIRSISHQPISINPGIRTAQETEKAPIMTGDSVSIGKNPHGTENKQSIKINILHVNDIHGAVEPAEDPKISQDSPVGGIAHATSVIHREKAKNPQGTLTLNAGDMAEGSMVAYLTKGKIVTEAFNQMGFDAIELGNHDFAWGQGELRNMVQGLDAPVLAGNVTKIEDGSVMDGVKPYIMKEVNGVKVAVIGVDTPDIERLVDKSKLEGLKFQDPAETVKKYMPEVKQQGADLVVVLSHLGFDEDKKLAQNVPGIDVIVGGHSHTVLPQGHKEGDTVIVQAGSLSQFVGNLELEVDPQTKKITGFTEQLLPIVSKDVQPDPEVMKVLSPYMQLAEKMGSEIMGTATEDLNYSHKEASKLNQIFTDALMEHSGGEIAVTSSRVLRGHVKKGDVKYKELYNAMPFSEENVFTLKTTGHKIKAEIESRIADGGRGIAVPGGFKYEYDSTLPSGQRVTSMTMPDGTPFNLDKEYTVVMNESTAKKDLFKDAKDVRVTDSMQKVFFDYFKSHAPWDNSCDDRVKGH